jgi:putative transposase
MEDVELMNEIRDIYIKHPFFGYRKVHAILKLKGRNYNRKRIQRLMRLCGLKAICPYKKVATVPGVGAEHKKYPYLLKDIPIDRPNKVWQVDITYIKIAGGFVYLTCLIDIFTRKIMSWHISSYLDTDACIQALNNALIHGNPAIINSDQGCQFTSLAWRSLLTGLGIQISMDGVGRWADNIYVERLWRTIRREFLVLHSFDTITDLRNKFAVYVHFYNAERPHQSLKYICPDQAYGDFDYVTSIVELVGHRLPVYGIMQNS